jgi:hypothetical protein
VSDEDATACARAYVLVCSSRETPPETLAKTREEARRALIERRYEAADAELAAHGADRPRASWSGG